MFQISPDVKTGVIKYCSDGVKKGILSTKALMNELKNAIVPNVYKTWLDESGDDAPLIPTFDDMMFHLNLTNICISTMWRWIKILGYTYDDNKK